ncbi:MAG: calcium/sodium antiporter [Bacteroidales bacterium]|nr:calcium/sodium antiporter [Bacteroidales bacterium]
MIVELLLVFIGLALVVFGADWLVDGSSAVARRANVSEFVIGLTIVGFGTSMPELVVSVTAAIEGNADISVGNIIGSNTLNILFGLGLTALIAPIAITRRNIRSDIPISIGAVILMLLMGMNSSILGIGTSDSLTRVEGIVFLLVFAAYIYYCFKTDDGADIETAPVKEIGLAKAVVLILAGLVGLVLGGRLFVDNAVDFAHRVGVSEKFIAITLIAGGTSLPELVTCFVAAAKKKGQMALGNILGSNLFNILLILGIAATLQPLSLAGIKMVDASVMLLSVLLVALSYFTLKNKKIDRLDGALMLLLEAAYMVWLFIKL